MTLSLFPESAERGQSPEYSLEPTQIDKASSPPDPNSTHQEQNPKESELQQPMEAPSKTKKMHQNPGEQLMHDQTTKSSPALGSKGKQSLPLQVHSRSDPNLKPGPPQVTQQVIGGRTRLVNTAKKRPIDEVEYVREPKGGRKVPRTELERIQEESTEDIAVDSKDREQPKAREEEEGVPTHEHAPEEIDELDEDQAMEQHDPVEKEEGEEGEEGMMEEDLFDPTAPVNPSLFRSHPPQPSDALQIVKFDAKTELIDKWDTIQKELVPFLQEFTEGMLSNTYDIIFAVAYQFHTLSETTKQSLTKGVKDIEDEEVKHESMRKQIIDFGNEMALVSQKFGQFGSAMTAIKGKVETSQWD